MMLRKYIMLGLACIILHAGTMQARSTKLIVEGTVLALTGAVAYGVCDVVLDIQKQVEKDIFNELKRKEAFSLTPPTEAFMQGKRLAIAGSAIRSNKNYSLLFVAAGAHLITKGLLKK